MARTVITPTTLANLKALPLTALAADFAFVNSDSVNGCQTTLSGPLILITNNTGGAGATVTVSSFPEGAWNRSGDITAYACAVGAISAFGVFSPRGWQQVDGNLYFTTSASTLKVVALSLPVNY